jgi:hypothetical protein
MTWQVLSRGEFTAFSWGGVGGGGVKRKGRKGDISGSPS